MRLEEKLPWQRRLKCWLGLHWKLVKYMDYTGPTITKKVYLCGWCKKELS